MMALVATAASAALWSIDTPPDCRGAWGTHLRLQLLRQLGQARGEVLQHRGVFGEGQNAVQQKVTLMLAE